jgi:hypothetical protein
MVAPPVGAAGSVVEVAGESSVTADPVDPRGGRVVDVVARAGSFEASVVSMLDGGTACSVMLVVGGPPIVVVVAVELVVAAVVEVVAGTLRTNDWVVQTQRKP